jgi:predicted Zn-dependent protease with MMP-like domain
LHYRRLDRPRRPEPRGHRRDGARGLWGPARRLLYDGIPLTEKSVMDQPHGPDTIWLFRRPILDEWADRGDIALGALVAHVYVHELAHHFGWSDAEIADIDPWWE